MIVENSFAKTPGEIGTIEVAIPVGQIEMCSQVPMWSELIKIKKGLIEDTMV